MIIRHKCFNNHQQLDYQASVCEINEEPQSTSHIGSTGASMLAASTWRQACQSYDAMSACIATLQPVVAKHTMHACAISVLQTARLLWVRGAAGRCMQARTHACICHSSCAWLAAQEGMFQFDGLQSIRHDVTGKQ